MGVLKKILKNKIVLALIVIAIAGGGYAAYRATAASPAQTRYLTANAEKQSISSSVSGSGQVSVIDQVDLKPEASGTIVSLNIANGQKVSAGALVAVIDNRTAARAVTDAETALETAELNLAKAKEPLDALTALQQQNSLISAQNSLAKAEDDFEKSYEDGFSSVSVAFLDLPKLMTGLQDALMGNDANRNQWNLNFYVDSAKTYDLAAENFGKTAYDSYLSARKSYDEAFAAYKDAGRDSTKQQIEETIGITYDAVLEISAAAKDANNLVQFYKDELTVHGLEPIALADTQLTELNGFITTANSRLSSLLSAKRAIESAAESIESAKRALAEKEAQIAESGKGPDAMEIRSLEIAIEQKKNALADAKDKLSDYYVRAPFAGTIADVKLKKGDTASSGAAIATLISPQQVAEISLNETDVAKVKLGQKAIISFDALEEVTLSGKVSEIGSLGSASQGVVSYAVTVAFDAQNDLVKPGMSLTASIITDFRADTLAVPSTAIKSQAGGSYVQVMKNGTPERREVRTGLSDDTLTEITEGLEEGEEVVTQTITVGSSPATANNRGGSTGIPGLTGGTTIRMNAPSGGFGGR